MVGICKLCTLMSHSSWGAEEVFFWLLEAPKAAERYSYDTIDTSSFHHYGFFQPSL